MNRRLNPVLASNSLLTMPMTQLLDRLHAPQRCEEAPTFSDLSASKSVSPPGKSFKQCAEWRKGYAELQALLAARFSHIVSILLFIESNPNRIAPV